MTRTHTSRASSSRTVRRRRFCSELLRLGGERVLGLPISRPFQVGSELYQAFEYGVLWWHAAVGQADLLDTLAVLHAAGRDGQLELSVDVLLLGALLRVIAELLGDYGPIAGPLIALGGLLSYSGFAIFAAGLWSSLRRLPRPSASPATRRV